MDRFIEIILNYMACVCTGLKSNMDRFIGFHGYRQQFYCKFKIQYG